MVLSKKQLEKIQEFVKDKLKNSDYNHDLRHIERTVKLAKFIAEKENANIDVCIVSAWLHDIAKNINEDVHGDLGAEMAEPLLKELDFDNKFIEQVKHCIFCHDTTNVDKARTIEAKVLYDADKLQVIGPFGFCRVFSDLVAFKKILLKDALIKTKEIQENRYEYRLQTKTGKDLARNSHKLMLEFYKLFDILDKADDLDKLIKS